jgi:hypothetical protein
MPALLGFHAVIITRDENETKGAGSQTGVLFVSWYTIAGLNVPSGTACAVVAAIWVTPSLQEDKYFEVGVRTGNQGPSGLECR